MDDTSRVFELEGLSKSAFFELARLKPTDAAIVKHLCERYEANGADDLDEELTYLRIRWLNAQCRWPWLNKLAAAYIQCNQKWNAYKCLVESLRNNPLQDDIFDQCEDLKEYSEPRYTQKLQDNACTVSVLMSTYNRPQIIRDAIRSVLSQTFKDYELIIVNDGATKAVARVVQSFAVARIRYFELARRSGWSAGLNMAINEAKGKYIAYLDDDDVYYPDHLEGMVSALERSHCKVIYNNNKAVGGKFEHGRFIPQRVFVREPVKFSRERLLHKGWFGNNNIMHHKSVFKDVGLFDDDLWAAEDWDMWLRMALRFDFDYVDATTTECRGRGDNISMKNRDEVLFFDIIVGNFYRYYMGKIAYVKHFLARSQEKEAYSLYDEISAGYENYFRTPELMRELIDFARHFGDTRFLMRLSRDYFSAGPRRWKKEALSHRPFEMILGALPAVPLKVFEKLRRCYPARRSAADLGNG